MLFTLKVILQWSEEVTDNRDAPRATEDFLSLHPTHVVHVSVMFWEAKDSERINHKDGVKVTKNKSINLIISYKVRIWVRSNIGIC